MCPGQHSTDGMMLVTGIWYLFFLVALAAIVTAAVLAYTDNPLTQ